MLSKLKIDNLEIIFNEEELKKEFINLSYFSIEKYLEVIENVFKKKDLDYIFHNQGYILKELKKLNIIKDYYKKENKYIIELNKEYKYKLVRRKFTTRIKNLLNIIEKYLEKYYNISELYYYFYHKGKFKYLDIFEYIFIVKNPYIKEKYEYIQNFRKINKKNFYILIENLQKENTNIQILIDKAKFEFKILSYFNFNIFKDSFTKNYYLFLDMPENIKEKFKKKKERRNIQQRDEYLKLHNINIKDNFEIHHIVPLKYGKSQLDNTFLDNIYNMLYIKKEIHKEIHKNELFLIKKITKNFLILTNINKSIELKIINTKDYFYINNKNELKNMKNYHNFLVNKFLLKY